MKKFISLILALTLILSIGISVGAANEGKFLHKYYEVIDGYIYALGAEVPAGGSYEITFASQEGLQGSMLTLGDTNISTTVYCLVETWKGLPDQAFDRAKEVLLSVSDHMSDKDKMIITTYGDEITESAILKNSTARKKAIESLGKKGEARPFYEAVNFALNSLSTKKGITENKCLIILSDGHDEISKSTTEAMVLDLIKDTTIPVYGVATLKDTPEAITLEYVDSITRLSKTSVGGKDYNTSKKGTAANQIGLNIWKSIQNSAVIGLEIASIDTKKLADISVLSVTYETKDSTFNDSVSVKTTDIINPNRSDNGDDEETGEVTVVPEESSISLPVIGAIVAVILIAVIVLLIILKNKGKTKGATEEPGPTIPHYYKDIIPPTTPIDNDNLGFIDERKEPKPLLPTPIPVPTPIYPDKTLPLHPMLRVIMTIIGQKGQSFEFRIPENTPRTLGRVKGKCDIVLSIGGAVDKSVSSCHCEFLWKDGKLFVKDTNSSNGTKVNNAILMNGMVQQIRDDDTIEIGSCTYRIKTFDESPASIAPKVQDYDKTLPL